MVGITLWARVFSSDLFTEKLRWTERPVYSQAGQIRRPKEGRNPKAEARSALGLGFRSSAFKAPLEDVSGR